MGSALERNCKNGNARAEMRRGHLVNREVFAGSIRRIDSFAAGLGLFRVGARTWCFGLGRWRASRLGSAAAGSRSAAGAAAAAATAGEQRAKSQHGQRSTNHPNHGSIPFVNRGADVVNFDAESLCLLSRTMGLTLITLASLRLRPQEGRAR